MVYCFCLFVLFACLPVCLFVGVYFFVCLFASFLLCFAVQFYFNAFVEINALERSSVRVCVRLCVFYMRERESVCVCVCVCVRAAVYVRVRECL